MSQPRSSSAVEFAGFTEFPLSPSRLGQRERRYTRYGAMGLVILGLTLPVSLLMAFLVTRTPFLGLYTLVSTFSFALPTVVLGAVLFMLTHRPIPTRMRIEGGEVRFISSEGTLLTLSPTRRNWEVRLLDSPKEDHPIERQYSIHLKTFVAAEMTSDGFDALLSFADRVGLLRTVSRELLGGGLHPTMDRPAVEIRLKPGKNVPSV